MGPEGLFNYRNMRPKEHKQTFTPFIIAVKKEKLGISIKDLTEG